MCCVGPRSKYPIDIYCSFFIIPWLFPSCRVAVWPMVLLLHIALSVSSPALSPLLFKSRWLASFHHVFGRLSSFSLVYPISTLSSLCVLHLSPLSSLLITCPYQFNLLGDLFGSPVTLIVPRMCSFLILSLHVTSIIALSSRSRQSVFSCFFIV